MTLLVEIKSISVESEGAYTLLMLVTFTVIIAGCMQTARSVCSNVSTAACLVRHLFEVLLLS
jgi:hypothetical protein